MRQASAVKPIVGQKEKDPLFYERRLSNQIIIAFQRWMQSSNLSQLEAAALMEMQPSALSRLLSGKTNMTMKSAGKLLCVAKFIPVITRDPVQK